MSGPWRIDDLRAVDDKAAAGLWVEAWNATMPSIDFAAREHWLLGTLAAARMRGEVLRAARAGGVIGFFMLRPADGHIEQICVAHCAWGSGVASALLADAKALSTAPLRLEVNAANTRARAFYRREGFIETGPGGGTLAGLPTLLMARG